MQNQWQSLVLGVGLLGASSTWGVGLGEIENKGYLNEPLSVAIPLLGDPLDFEMITVNLASELEHNKAGVLYPSNIPRIEFRVLKSLNGHFLELRSLARVKEPIVDMLVEVRFSGGSIFKQVTLLLDPEPMQSFSSKRADTTSVASKRPSDPVPEAMVVSRPNTSSSLKDSSNVVVQRGDSLWKLASRWQLPGHSVHQKMDLIFEQNKDAFIGNDRNKLMEGANLILSDSIGANRVVEKTELPTEQEVKQLSAIPDIGASLSENTAAASLEQSDVEQSLREQLKLAKERLALVKSQNEELQLYLARAERLLSNVETQAAETLVGGDNNVVSTVAANAMNIPESQQAAPESYQIETEPAVINPDNSQEQSTSTIQVKFSEQFNMWLLFGLAVLSGWLLFRFISRLYSKHTLRKIQQVFDEADERKLVDKKFRVPDIDELPLSSIHSIPQQIAQLKAAAELYIQHHRYDLAKSVVNTKLIQYAGNSHFVEKLEELRGWINRSIDSHLKHDLEDKLSVEDRNLLLKHAKEENDYNYIRRAIWDKKVS